LGQEIKFGLADNLGIIDAVSAEKNQFAVDSRDMTLHYLYNMVMHEPTQENHMALQNEITHRIRIDTIFKKTFGNHMADMETIGAPKDFECYRELIDHFETNCEKLDDYSLKYAKLISAECDVVRSYPEALNATKARIEETCNPSKTNELLSYFYNN
jgi:hypothetical protein